MPGSEQAAVLFVNEAFYAAFADRDFESLDGLWSREHAVVCMHPGWPPLHGRDEVMQSWAAILANPASPKIACQAARATFLSADACLVTCLELIGDTVLVASNTFVREAEGWRLVHHHASPSTASPPESVDDGSPAMQ